LDELHSYFRSNPRAFYTIINAAILMCDFEIVKDETTEDVNILNELLAKFMSIVTNVNEDISEQEDVLDTNSVNSYTEDNNTNNNEESTITREELDRVLNSNNSNESDDMEDEILNQKVLDAILELTKAVNVNSEIMAKQNELMTLKLNSLDGKIDNITDLIIKPEQKYGDENVYDSIADTVTIMDKVYNPNNGIVTLSENDLDNKIIAVDINDTTVCFDILNLAKKAIGSTEQDTKYLSVTDIVVSNL
jgi:hypothetical protein